MKLTLIDVLFTSTITGCFFDPLLPRFMEQIGINSWLIESGALTPSTDDPDDESPAAFKHVERASGIALTRISLAQIKTQFVVFL